MRNGRRINHGNWTLHVLLWYHNNYRNDRLPNALTRELQRISSKNMCNVLYFIAVVVSLLLSLGFTHAQSTYVCEPINDECVLQKQYDECMALVNNGCPNIKRQKRCPVLYSCTSPFSSPVKKNMKMGMMTLR